jgi:hypothetical protein
MTSPPHDLNGEEPGRNDYRGGRAEIHPHRPGMRGTRRLRSVIHPPTAGRPEQHDLCAAAAEAGTGVISSYSAVIRSPMLWTGSRAVSQSLVTVVARDPPLSRPGGRPAWLSRAQPNEDSVARYSFAHAHDHWHGSRSRPGRGRRHSGLWWQDWAAWADARADRIGPPPMGSERHPALGEAPGECIRS